MATVALAAVPVVGFVAATVTYAVMSTDVQAQYQGEAQLLVFSGLVAALAGVCAMSAAVAAPFAIQAWRTAPRRTPGRVAAAAAAALLVATVAVLVYFLYVGLLPYQDAGARHRRALVMALWAGIYMIPIAVILRVATLPASTERPALSPVTGAEIRDHQLRATRIRGTLISLSLVVTLATAGTVALLSLLTGSGEASIAVLGTEPVTLSTSDARSFAGLIGLIYATGLVFAYVPARLAIDSAGRNLIDRAHPLPPSDDATFTPTRRRREELQAVLGVGPTGRQTIESSIALLAPLITGLAAPLLE